MKTISNLIILGIIFISHCKCQNTNNQNIDILNTVWNTINTEYFDTTFNGLDWQKEYDYYKPIIESCESNDSLYFYLNQLVFKLNVSHLGVISAEEANESGDPQLFFDGTAGIQLRYLNNEIVITSVENNSSADKAGIRPGYTILKVNNKTIDSFVLEKKRNPTPPFNERNFRSLVAQNINTEFYGLPGDSVQISYFDNNKIQNKILVLGKRNSSKIDVIPGMPAMYACSKSQIINDSIGYIYFDAFLPHILDSILINIDNFKKYPNLIIDLRGNPGGIFDVRKEIAEQFVSETTLFWKYFSRGNIDNVYLTPAINPYEGRLVILIDEHSTSSSEEFAGGMKAIGRATIIGQQTPGKVLTMEVIPLPDGAFFIYPNQQTITSKNEILEANGVIPDIKITLNKESLLKGEDSQLTKAIEFLSSTNPENSKVK